jgi:paraquat-inducible protein B
LNYSLTKYVVYKEWERTSCLIDEQRQQRMNEAADKFFRTGVRFYRAVAERGISAHRFNAELAQQFCNGMIESLRRTAEETRGASQDLTEQSRRGQEATQALAQGAMGVYTEFVDSIFGLYQGGTQGERSARKAQR